MSSEKSTREARKTYPYVLMDRFPKEEIEGMYRRAQMGGSKSRLTCHFRCMHPLSPLLCHLLYVLSWTLLRDEENRLLEALYDVVLSEKECEVKEGTYPS